MNEPTAVELARAILDDPRGYKADPVQLARQVLKEYGVASDETKARGEDPLGDRFLLAEGRVRKVPRD